MTSDKLSNVISVLGPPDAQFVWTDDWNTTHYCGWWAPIYTRTLANCVYGDPIGCIDKVLMNRLEANTDYLDIALRKQLYVHENTSQVATVWQREMYIHYSDMRRIKVNIQRLRESGFFDDTTTVMPTEIASEGIPTFEQINNWERCLYDTFDTLNAVNEWPRVLGTFKAGNDYQRQHFSIRR